MTTETMKESNVTTGTQLVESPASAGNPMSLMQLAVQKGADTDQLEKLMSLQERWERNEAAKAYSLAVADFQGRCPTIEKTRGVSMTRGGDADYYFASYDDIMRVVRPLLSEFGLSVSFSSPTAEAGSMSITCRVRCGVHVEETTFAFPVPSQMRVNDTQKMGAALAYAKRYALCAALNIVVGDEDTDGAGMPGSAATVTDEQAIELGDMIDGLAESRRPKFLAAYEIESIYDMPAARYAEARSALLRALKKEGNS